MGSLTDERDADLCLLSLSKLELREIISNGDSIVPKTWRFKLSKLNGTGKTSQYGETLELFIKKFGRILQRLIWVDSSLLETQDCRNIADTIRVLFNHAKKLKEIQISYVSRQNVNEFLMRIVAAKQKGWLEQLTILNISNFSDGMFLDDLHLDLVTGISIPWVELKLSEVIVRAVECKSLEELLRKNSRYLRTLQLSGIFPNKESQPHQLQLLVMIPEMQELEHLILSMNFMKTDANTATSGEVPALNGHNEVPEDDNKSKKLILRFSGDMPRLKSLVLGPQVEVEKLSFSVIHNMHTFHCRSSWHKTINFPPLGNGIIYNNSLVTSLHLPDGLKDHLFIQNVANFLPNITKLAVTLPSAPVVRAIFLHLSSSKLEELTLQTQYDFYYVLDTILFPGLDQSLDDATAQTIWELKRCIYFNQLVAQFQLELPSFNLDPSVKGIEDMKSLKKLNLEHIPRIPRINSRLKSGLEYRTLFSDDVACLSNITHKRLSQLPLEINLTAITEKNAVAEEPPAPKIVSVTSNAMDTQVKETHYDQRQQGGKNEYVACSTAESIAAKNAGRLINIGGDRIATEGNQIGSCLLSEESTLSLFDEENLNSSRQSLLRLTAEYRTGSHKNVNVVKVEESLNDSHENLTEEPADEIIVTEELSIKTEKSEIFMHEDDFQNYFATGDAFASSGLETLQTGSPDVIVAHEVPCPPEDVVISSDEDEMDAMLAMFSEISPPRQPQRVSKYARTRYSDKDEEDLDYMCPRKISKTTQANRRKTRRGSLSMNQRSTMHEDKQDDNNFAGEEYQNSQTSRNLQRPVKILSLSYEGIENLIQNEDLSRCKNWWQFDCSGEIKSEKIDIDTLFSFFSKTGISVERLQWSNCFLFRKQTSTKPMCFIRPILKSAANLKEIMLSNVCAKTVNTFLLQVKEERTHFGLRSLDSLVITSLKGGAVLDNSDILLLSTCGILWRKLELSDFNLDEEGWDEVENLLKACEDHLEYFKIHGGIDPDYEEPIDKFTPMTLKLPTMPKLVYLFVSLRFQKEGGVEEIKALRPTEFDFIPITANVFDYPYDIIIKLSGDYPKLKTLILGNRVVVEELPFSVIRKLQKFECGSQWNLNTRFPPEGSRTAVLGSQVTCLQLPDGLQDRLFVSKIPQYFPKVTKLTVNIPSRDVLRSVFTCLCDLKIQNLVLRTQFDFEFTLEPILFPELQKDQNEVTKEAIAALRNYPHYEKFVRDFNIDVPTEGVYDEKTKGITHFTSLKVLHLEHIPRVLPVPSRGEQKLWWEKDFVQSLSTGLTVSEGNYPLTTACHEKLKALNVEIKLKSFK